MAKIFPFRGIRYHPGKTPNLDTVVTPPYDVITPEAQEQYYRSHPYNFVRLDLGKIHPDDHPGNNRYTRAASDYRNWMEQKVLIQDEHPALYRYEITYAHSDEAPSPSESGEAHRSTRTLHGWFASVALEPYDTGMILPHEDTFPNVKQDRLDLLRTCQANFSPIFCLYTDPEGSIQSLLEQGSSEQPPSVDVVFRDQTHHRLWEVTDPALVRKVQNQFANQKLLIADGHHRYETALAYQQENPAASRMLILLASMQDPGLSLLSTHRVLQNLTPRMVDQIRSGLTRHFEVDNTPQDVAELFKNMQDNRDLTVLGLFSTQGNFQILKIKPESLQKATPGTTANQAPLDVDLFDQIILDNLLGLKGGASDRAHHLQYVKEPEEGIQMVQSGRGQFAFFLNPTPIEVVLDLAHRGIKMPHKSTYFYPKPLSGLVFYPFPASP